MITNRTEEKTCVIHSGNFVFPQSLLLTKRNSNTAIIVVAKLLICTPPCAEGFLRILRVLNLVYIFYVIN
jgi:hypothetical protein